MSRFTFRSNFSLVSSDRISVLASRLKREIEQVRSLWGSGYDNEYAFLSLSADQALHSMIEDVVHTKKKFKPDILVVIGIGGSNLGAYAIHEALHGSLYNETEPTVRVHWADTVDSEYTRDIEQVCKKVLTHGGTVMLAIISKSGMTTETLANAQVFLKLLADFKKPLCEHVVVITDHDSPLWRAAQRDNIVCLAIPQLVGGRFSVFSSVGLFPLSMLGVDIKALLAGAESMKATCCDTDITKNPAALSAAIVYDRYHAGCVIYDTFLFSCALKGVGAWYRQLLAESIGKMHDRHGKLVRVGITPTVSLGTTDLHSVGQLYAAGPFNRVTTFVTVPPRADVVVPSQGPFGELASYLSKTSFSIIMDAFHHSVMHVYRKDSRPFMSIELSERSAYALGQFMQLKMVEIVYLAHLFAINPFDQPQVELYKAETRRMLEHA